MMYLKVFFFSSVRWLSFWKQLSFQRRNFRCRRHPGSWESKSPLLRETYLEIVARRRGGGEDYSLKSYMLLIWRMLLAVTLGSELARIVVILLPLKLLCWVLLHRKRDHLEAQARCWPAGRNVPLNWVQRWSWLAIWTHRLCISGTVLLQLIWYCTPWGWTFKLE